MAPTFTRRHPAGYRGFTLTELLVVIGVIAVLLAFLLPALGGVWGTAQRTDSMNNMRQISQWMRLYSGDNDDYVVPSRFDYTESPYPGKVRSNATPAQGVPNTGTWCDILSAENEVGVYVDASVPIASGGLGNDYRFDSPDKALYDLIGEDQVINPFRAAAPNSRGADMADEAVPYGVNGADEQGYPGFFAANDFFFAGWPGSADPAMHYTNGQIQAPNRAMYLVDSFRGEVIDDVAIYFEPGAAQFSVDFRYDGGEACLMLFMDGHTDTITRWDNFIDLIDDRGIRIWNLDQR